ncbi:MAG: hypothetical protein ACUVX8_01785 [Candidatus Zipacnadales bacterium]
MSSPIKITSPIHGDIMNRHDIFPPGDEPLIGVFGEAPTGAAVNVNGRPAEREGQFFRCRVPLMGVTTKIIAELADGTGSTSITVLWDRTDKKRYRFSLDDNVRFLSDIAKQPHTFPSLFDHPYLGFWRRMHQEYGTKVHINIYYQECWGVLPEGQAPWFNLSLMPDTYKGEWQANADWLRLTFHAREDKPDRIYKDATYEEMARDYEKVVNEVKRFAGEELLSRFTTVHWAEAPREACRALRDRGVEGLLGLFVTSAPDATFTRYYLSPEMGQHIAGREAWKDLDEDIVFISCDAVVNGLTLDRIEPHLNEVELNPHTSELIELLIHEQYFRPELKHYQPDVFDKVETAIRWVTDRGYEPTFWQEGLLDALRE